MTQLDLGVNKLNAFVFDEKFGKSVFSPTLLTEGITAAHSHKNQTSFPVKHE